MCHKIFWWQFASSRGFSFPQRLHSSEFSINPLIDLLNICHRRGGEGIFNFYGIQDELISEADVDDFERNKKRRDNGMLRRENFFSVDICCRLKGALGWLKDCFELYWGRVNFVNWQQKLLSCFCCVRAHWSWSSCAIVEHFHWTFRITKSAYQLIQFESESRGFWWTEKFLWAEGKWRPQAEGDWLWSVLGSWHSSAR